MAAAAGSNRSNENDARHTRDPRVQSQPHALPLPDEMQRVHVADVRAEYWSSEAVDYLSQPTRAPETPMNASSACPGHAHEYWTGAASASARTAAHSYISYGPSPREATDADLLEIADAWEAAGDYYTSVSRQPAGLLMPASTRQAAGRTFFSGLVLPYFRYRSTLTSSHA